jgi:hypothetical protein
MPHATRWSLTRWTGVVAAAALVLTSGGAGGQERGMAGPNPPALSEVVTGMPRGERQEVRVFSVTLKPGDKTPFHTHRFPVTVYILEGAFTLEMKAGRPSPSRPARRWWSRRTSR